MDPNALLADLAEELPPAVAPEAPASETPADAA